MISRLFTSINVVRRGGVIIRNLAVKKKSNVSSNVNENLVNGKAAALQIALKQIESQFGKGSLMKLGSREHIKVPFISTGSLTIDAALGIGGLPRGRVIEIFGPESSGKTTMALHVVAELQKTGGTCAFIDAEHALDPVYAQKIGVNIDEMYISQPDSGEQALSIADTLVRSGAMDVIIIDSVAALVPRAEAEGEMGDHHMALQARLMSQALRKITASLTSSNTTIIFINQIRQKIGVMFGNPETTSGGNALKFYASIRMDIRRTSPIKNGDEVIGYETKVKIVKNKVAPPFRQATFDMMFGEGICKTGELIDMCVQEGLITKSGSWFSYKANPSNAEDSTFVQFGQGREKAKTFLKNNLEVNESLRKVLRAKMLDDKNEVKADEEEELEEL